MRAPTITRMSGPTLDTTDDGFVPGGAAGASLGVTGVSPAVQTGVLGAAPGAPAGGARPAPPPSPGRMLTNKAGEAGPAKPSAVGDKIGRNDPCPCGSGKKYKKCHGRLGG